VCWCVCVCGLLPAQLHAACPVFSVDAGLCSCLPLPGVFEFLCCVAARSDKGNSLNALCVDLETLLKAASIVCDEMSDMKTQYSQDSSAMTDHHKRLATCGYSKTLPQRFTIMKVWLDGCDAEVCSDPDEYLRKLVVEEPFFRTCTDA
jgi:hypothetical protein